jgi:natural resistance-associated macrophage protein
LNPWQRFQFFSGRQIAYLDPGNIEADLQSGAKGGYSLLWVLLWATILGGFIQILTARLGVVSGKNLAQVARQHLPRPVSICMWLLAELAIITSDIQEVIGSAIALNILFGLKIWIGVLVTAADTFTFLFIHAYGVRKLELFFAFLVGTMAIAFAVCFSISKPDIPALFRGLLIPSVTAETSEQAVGQLGAVIMPHNLYLHSALVLSRQINRSNRGAVRMANFYNAIESIVSLCFSFSINVLVIGVFAAGFYQQANADVAGLSIAGDLLQERFGSIIRVMWAVGLLASGQSSTMTGTLAGQHVMLGYIDLDVKPWIRVFITRSLAIAPASFVAVTMTGQLDRLNEFLNVAQSIQLPFALLPLLLFSSCADIMGEFALGRCTQAFLYTVFIVLLGINVYLLQSLAATHIGLSPAALFGYTVFGIAYFGLLAFLMWYVLFRRIEIQEEQQEPVQNTYAFLSVLSPTDARVVDLVAAAAGDDVDVPRAPRFSSDSDGGSGNTSPQHHASTELA